jgi:hypothetical protein
MTFCFFGAVLVRRLRKYHDAKFHCWLQKNTLHVINPNFNLIDGFFKTSWFDPLCHLPNFVAYLNLFLSFGDKRIRRVWGFIPKAKDNGK